MYTCARRRKKVSKQVKITWPGNDIPKVQNNPKMQKQVAALVQEMVDNKCTTKYFGAAEIRQHVLSCLNEQRCRVPCGEDLKKVCVFIK